MRGDESFGVINESKAELDHIYNRRDPRSYFRELRKVGYVIPDAAKPLFEKLASLLRKRRQGRVRILDIGCSYGVNAALLKYDMTMAELYEHWGGAALAQAASEQVIERDRRFFESRPNPRNIEVIGLDQAEHAVSFADQVGLLDRGVAVNLEEQPVPGALEAELRDVDLVTSTGCIGYVTEKSFERLLPALTAGALPWMANFVLRIFPFDAIDRTLSKWGYVTEKLEGRTFVQRRFVDDDERGQILGQLRAQGIDPRGKEADGRLHAEFYLSRPRNAQLEIPLHELAAV